MYDEFARALRATMFAPRCFEGDGVQPASFSWVKYTVPLDYTGGDSTGR